MWQGQKRAALHASQLSFVVCRTRVSRQQLVFICTSSLMSALCVTISTQTYRVRLWPEETDHAQVATKHLKDAWEKSAPQVLCSSWQLTVVVFGYMHTFCSLCQKSCSNWRRGKIKLALLYWQNRLQLTKLVCGGRHNMAHQNRNSTWHDINFTFSFILLTDSILSAIGIVPVSGPILNMFSQQSHT